MKRTSLSTAPVRAGKTLALLAITALLLLPGLAAAADTDVVRVEEDWELVLTEPDVATVAPQVTCTMSPYTNLDDTYFTFEINHLSAPSFSPGGLHVHLWSGDWRQDTFSRTDRSVISTINDTVRWTQVLRIGSGRLKFEIKDGTSATWGVFGYSGLMAVEKGWGASNINSYSPEVSVANAGIGFASNRVASLKLKCVRKTLANGQTVTDNTQRVVFVQE